MTGRPLIPSSNSGRDAPYSEISPSTLTRSLTRPVVRKPVPLSRARTVSDESLGDAVYISGHEPIELRPTRSNTSIAYQPSENEDQPLQLDDGVASETYRDKEKSGGGQGKWGRHLKAWVPEYLWCAASIALLVALVVILTQYNNKPMPQWNLGITLNTVVALLATACRACTVIPVSEGVSQLKWNWFAKKERRIKDLHTFDQASRGPWGSFHMAVTTRGRILSILAAVIMVSGLATSTLTQSAIAYTNRLEPNATLKAISASAHSYPPHLDDHDGFDSQGYIDRLESVAFQASLYPLGEAWPELQPSCPTGDCRWPQFDSLAVCVDMSNVTDSLKVKELEKENGRNLRYNATLLDGEVFLYENLEMNAKTLNMTSLEPTTTPDPDPESDMDPSDFVYYFPPVYKSIAHASDSDVLGATFSQFYLIWNNINTDPEDKDHRYRAVELLWHFCVKKYEVIVTGGVATTNATETTTRIVDSSNGTATGLPFFALASAEGDQTFKVADEWEYIRLDLDFRRAFAGDFSTSDGIDASYTEMLGTIGQNVFEGLDSNMTVEAYDDKEWNNLGQAAQTIANSMTNFIRGRDRLETGQALSAVTYVTVRWGWISFIAVQIALTIAFLLGVVVHTAKLDMDVVKSSNLAELFASGLEEQAGRESAGDGNNASTTGLKRSVSHDLLGQLQRDEDGKWRLLVERRYQPAPSRQSP